MNATYDQCIADLRREIETGGARPAVIDIAVNDLLEERREQLPSDLLSLLTDSAKYDEGMFSLIHAAETYDNIAYVRSLLTVFPQLVSSSPRWASIVLMRVLNNPSTQAEMVTQLRTASAASKDATREMCDRINSVNPEFLSKTIPVTLAAVG